MITTEILDNKELIEDACALLHTSYIDQGQWQFAPNNPSKMRVETKNGRKLLVDKYTFVSRWFGIFDDDKLIGCARLCGLDENNKYEIEGYEASRIVHGFLPRADCMEMGRVAVSMDYRGRRVVNQLYLVVFEYCQKNKFSVFGCINNPYIKSLFHRVKLLPKMEQAFKYEESDPAPVNFYLVNYKLNEFSDITGNLRNSINEKTNKNLYSVKHALEIVAPILPVPVYWHDKNGMVLGMNDLCLNGMGSTCDQVIGKNPYHFYPEEVAAHILRHNDLVMRTEQILSQEESINNITTGARVYAKAVKAPLYDDNGNVIGILGTSIDITAEKEFERLEIENQIQQTALEYQAKIVSLARKVAHDINSPLASLRMTLGSCNELPEGARAVMNRAIESVLDIANNLLSTYKKEETHSTSEIELRQPVLISDLLIQLLSEKKAQYVDHAIRFENSISDEAQFAFAQLQPSQFRRTISNMINNAVDALSEKNDGSVIIRLNADADSIAVAIEDNGQGMPATLIDKMLNREGFTSGKLHGHGLGLQQVWDTLDSNEGKITAQSEVGKGAVIQLTFPRVAKATWIAHSIRLRSDSIVVVLDDDESIHGAWDARFKLLLAEHPALQVHHFTQGENTLDFFNSLSAEDRSRAVFLSDFELLKQNQNGLQVILESRIQNSTLVTSYYANQVIRDRAAEIGIKIVPKQMASVIPIDFEIVRELASSAG